MPGRILIVDNAATNRILLKVKLAAAYYQPLLAASGAECLKLARSEQPDVILLDLMLPDINGIEVLRLLRSDPITRAIPVIIVSASVETAARIAAFHAGADAFLTKPVEDQVLLARMRSLIAARTEVEGLTPEIPLETNFHGFAEASVSFEKPALIALIARDTAEGESLRQQLHPLVTDRLIVAQRKDALSNDSVLTPDAYLIDADLDIPGGGLRLMSELRSRQTGRHAVFCIRRPADRPDLTPIAFDLGAHEVVSESDDPRELAARLKATLRRKSAADRLRASVRDRLRMAILDPLTGLFNRRYGFSQLTTIAAAAAASSSSFAVLIADIDRFKQVNDSWGHSAGDQVLIEVAARLKRILSPEDLLARIGGEEFLIVLPQTGLEEAHRIAENIRSVIHSQPFDLPHGVHLEISLSIGLALIEGSTDLLPKPGNPTQIEIALDRLIDRADQALLRAKAMGRNRIKVHQNTS